MTDFFLGTAKNDTVTATTATLQTGDFLRDESSTDNDVIKLTATADVSTAGASIAGFEKLEVNWDSFSDASVDLANFKGLKEVSVSTAKLGNVGNLTVNNAAAAKVVAGAGITGTLTVNGVTTGSVETGLAKTVVVNAVAATTAGDETVAVAGGVEAVSITVGDTGPFDTATVTAGAKTTTVAVTSAKSATVTASAATTTIGTNTVASTIDATAAAKDAVITVTGTGGTIDTATVKLGNDAAVTVAAFTATTEKVILDVAAGKTVTLNNAAGTVEVKGAGDVTLKGTSTNLGGDTITKANAGKLNVELTDVGVATFDSTKIAADSIKLSAGATVALTAKSGQNLEVAGLAAGTTAITVGALATTGTFADTLNLKLTSAQYGAIANVAGTPLVPATDLDFETLTIEAAAATAAGAASNPEVTIASIAAGETNTVVLKGTNDVAITNTAAATTAKAIDASALNGALTIGTGVGLGLVNTAVNGATGINTIGFGDVAADQAATFVGQAGNDVITLDSTAVAGGAAGSKAGQATFVTGAGNDSVTVSAVIAGVLSVQAGEGDDVVSLAGAQTGTIVLEFGNGNDTLSLANGANLSGANLTLTGLENIAIGGAANASADNATIASKNITGQAFTVKGNGGADTLTVSGSAAADTIDLSKIVINPDSLSSAATLIVNAGAENDTITGSAFADQLKGEAGNDTINGGAGNDTITGGADADILSGGAGNDIFVFATAAETKGTFALTDTTSANIDKITDFVGNGASAGDSFSFAAAVAITGATGATVTAKTVTTAATFADIATGLGALTASTAAATGAQVYDVTVSGGALAGRYVVVNNADAVFDATDAIINITGATGALHASDFAFA